MSTTITPASIESFRPVESFRTSDYTTKTGKRSVAGELLTRKFPETVTRALVRAERLLVGVPGIGGDLLRDRLDLSAQGIVVLRVTQQGLDPRVVGVLGAELLFEQELSQEDADADIGERPKGEDAMRRADETIDLRVLRLDARDDVADGLVDEREPDFLGACHVDRIGQDSRRRARHAICAATRTSNPAKRRRRVASGSDTARATPPWAAAAAATPSTAAARQRTLP